MKLVVSGRVASSANKDESLCVIWTFLILRLTVITIDEEKSLKNTGISIKLKFPMDPSRVESILISIIRSQLNTARIHQKGN